ncbi:NACHT and ankyrin domain protein [Mycena sanguinolenta]|uniref:NACHT and ankyrin domain protein n=1 Tax=Mycena sanguinolenta TaxID=230812 RepID=A0A8H7CPT4_9AGAR|nr:NACHT and ankyrin domain protein [Mycena sanguinolenta]
MSESSNLYTFHMHGGYGGPGGPGNAQGVGGPGGVGEGSRLAIGNISNATFNVPEGEEVMFWQRDAILDWLSPINFFQRQADISQLRAKGTCEWLLADQVFKDWELSSGGTLWCSGISGAGKTILVSMVVDYLCTQSKDKNIGVACIYLNYKEADSQTPSRLLAGLWRQLVGRDIGSLAQDLYNQHREKGTAPSLEEAASILMSRVTELAKVFIIIDAMDEYPEAQQCILLKHLVEIGSKVNLMITSRPNISPEDYSFQGVQTLDILARPEDIQTYIDVQINSSALVHRIKEKPELRESIHTAINDAAHGMFLLVKFQLEFLCTKRTIKAVREALKRLPKDLYDSYSVALQRIDTQNEDDRKIAYSALSWVTDAKRPLTVDELLVALAVEPETHELDEENVATIGEILSLCAGLVMVDEKLKVVRLVHYTTQEYLDKIQAEKFPNAQTKIAHTLLTFLTFDGYPVSTWPLDNLPPLVEYSQYCLAHAAESPDDQLREILLKFFGRADQWLKVLNGAGSEWNYHWRFPPWNYSDRPSQLSPLWIAAAGNLVQTVTSLLNKGPVVGGNTELVVASYYGHTEIVCILLENGADVNAEGGKYHRTALQAAAGEGHTGIVCMLLKKGADINAEGRESHVTALQAAAARGHTEIVHMLLEKGADINAKGGLYHQTALQAAAAGGHIEIVHMLLDKEANFSTERSKYYETALRAAVAGGHIEIVHILLEKGANVSAKVGMYHETALQSAAATGHTEILGILLHKGADVSAQGGKYPMTGLQIAAARGNTEVVRMLIEKGADINAKGGLYHQTALQAAAAGGHLETVCILLEKGADISTNGDEHGTALQAAAAGGHTETVCILLEKGANVNIEGSKYSGTALQAAAAGGHTETVCILLDKGADISTKGGKHGTALQAAAAGGHRKTVHMLLDKGANISAEGGKHGTALQAAAAGGHTEIVGRGGKHGTALQAAAAGGNTEIVGMLLAKGAYINAEGGEYGSSLQAAALRGHTETARMLLDKSAAINAGAGKYRSSLNTELVVASHFGNTEIVHIFLEGADVNAERSDYYGTALQAAAGGGHTEITALQAAAAEGHIESICILLEKGADSSTEGGVKMGLHCRLLLLEAIQRLLAYFLQRAAAANGNTEIVHLFLDKGAEINAGGGEYGSALQAAAANDHTEIVSMLLAKGAVTVNTSHSLINK